jgi:hypothetical protein
MAQPLSDALRPKRRLAGPQRIESSAADHSPVSRRRSFRNGIWLGSCRLVQRGLVESHEEGVDRFVLAIKYR